MNIIKNTCLNVRCNFGVECYMDDCLSYIDEIQEKMFKNY